MIERFSIWSRRQDAFTSARLRLQHVGLRGPDGDDLARAADLEPYDDAARVVRAEHDAVMLGCHESGELHCRSYVPGNRLLNVNAPRSSVTAVRGRSGGRVDDDDRGAPQEAASRVFDAASQRGGGSADLRRHRHWKKEEQEHTAGGQAARVEDGVTGWALVVSASDHLKCSISIRSDSSRTSRL